MKLFAPLLCLVLAAGPVFADDPVAPGNGNGAEQGTDKGADQGDVGKGFSLMQEGTKLMLRGMMAQMEPKMRDLMATLVTLMGDLSAYEAPEVLPNGDIIIRRKIPLVPVPPGAPGTETEL